jgi:hypothetical protein
MVQALTYIYAVIGAISAAALIAALIIKRRLHQPSDDTT